MEANPVGASCARVCPTSELCEGACVLNESSKPILIGLLQRHATDWAIKNNATFYQKGESNGKQIAVIGSGPAGLSASRELARLGYDVTIYEAKEKSGGLSTYGIVSFRLPQEIPQWEVKQIKQLGVKIQYNTRVGEDIQPADIISQYDSVLLTVGMGSVPHLQIEGEELDGVLEAISFIEDTKTSPFTHQLHRKKVVVIGAGNTAIDAATCSKRLGADQVQMLYRRTEAEMTAYEFEYEFAKLDGIEFRWLVSPKRIIGSNGKVTGIELVRMELGEPDEKGRRRPLAIPNSEFTIEVDYVIKAIGQSRYLSLIHSFQLEHRNGVVLVEEETYKTTKEQVFAAGDFIFGGGQTEATVVDAAEQGKQAAYAINKYLNNI